MRFMEKALIPMFQELFEHLQTENNVNVPGLLLHPKDPPRSCIPLLWENSNFQVLILMRLKAQFTEEFFEEDHIIRMRSVIMVERETQKGIIIGHKGSALKRVGIESRKDLEAFFGKKVHLELYVKVNKNWRSNQKQLKRFGYNPS